MNTTTDYLETMADRLKALMAESQASQTAADPRRIIQITATADAGAASDLLYALCDDGTLWWVAPQSSDDIWRKVRDIPQEETPNE